MQKRKTITFDGEKLFLDVSSYRNNGRLAVIAYTEDELYSDITINLSNLYVSEDRAFISDDAKSCGLEEKLVKLGIIKYVLRCISL